jgi:hypothetical protein
VSAPISLAVLAVAGYLGIVAAPAAAYNGAARPSQSAIRQVSSGRGPLGFRPATASPLPGQMTNHGGSVQTQPKLYVDFWGWSSDPYGVQSYLTSFLSSVGNSAWLGALSQYGGGTDPTLAGVWSNTTSAPPTSPTDTDLYNQAVAASVHFNLSSTTQAQIILALPTGTTLSSTGHPTDCAYHQPFSSPSTGYTVLPYIPDFGAECGYGAVNYNSPLDGVSIVEGHELAESITDPELNAWYDANGNEVADKCAWYDLANSVMSGGTFAVQPLWSNSAKGCVLHGEAPTTASSLGLQFPQTTLPPAAGSTDLFAEVTDATTCTFSSTPALGGLPSTIPCSNGQVDKKFRFPANPGPRSVVYDVKLVAVGATRTTTTGTIFQWPPPVNVTLKKITPTSGPDTGGTAATLVGTGFYANAVYGVEVEANGTYLNATFKVNGPNKISITTPAASGYSGPAYIDLAYCVGDTGPTCVSQESPSVVFQYTG